MNSYLIVFYVQKNAAPVCNSSNVWNSMAFKFKIQFMRSGVGRMLTERSLLKNQNHETIIERKLLGLIYNWIIDMTTVGD